MDDEQRKKSNTATYAGAREAKAEPTYETPRVASGGRGGNRPADDPAGTIRLFECLEARHQGSRLRCRSAPASRPPHRTPLIQQSYPQAPPEHYLAAIVAVSVPETGTPPKHRCVAAARRPASLIGGVRELLPCSLAKAPGMMILQGIWGHLRGHCDAKA